MKRFAITGFEIHSIAERCALTETFECFANKKNKRNKKSNGINWICLQWMKNVYYKHKKNARQTFSMLVECVTVRCRATTHQETIPPPRQLLHTHSTHTYASHRPCAALNNCSSCTRGLVDRTLQNWNNNNKLIKFHSNQTICFVSNHF